MISMVECVRRDVARNAGNPKSMFIVLFFRLAHIWRGDGMRPRRSALPIGILYRLIVEWLLNVEIPWGTRVGPGLVIQHGHSLVVNASTIIGTDVTLRHCVTLGNRRLPDGLVSEGPRIGDGVEFGTGAIVLGEIDIGEFSVIGAGSVVTKPVPARATVAGNPARILSRKDPFK